MKSAKKPFVNSPNVHYVHDEGKGFDKAIRSIRRF